MRKADSSCYNRTASSTTAPMMVRSKSRLGSSVTVVEGLDGAADDQHQCSLVTSLKLIWKVTHFTGILFDWCIPLSKKGDIKKRFRITTMIRSIFACLIILMMGAMFAIMVYQLVNVVKSDSTINDIIVTLIRISSIPLAIQVQLFFILKRRTILAFFQRFDQLDSQLIHCRREILKFRRIVYSVVILTSTISLMGVVSVLTTLRDEPFSYTHYEVLREAFTAPVLKCVTLLTYVLITFYVMMADLVPSFVYSHAAFNLSSICQQLRTKRELMSTNDRYVHSLWLRHNLIRQLVDSANDLFGPLIITNLSIKFFALCTLAYSALHSSMAKDSNDPYLGLVFSINLSVILSRLISDVLCMSKVSLAGGKLLTETNSSLTLCWYDLNKDSRQVLSSFRAELLSHPLAAAPWGLFRITPSLLLTLFGLALSYIIVLVQSQT